MKKLLIAVSLLTLGGIILAGCVKSTTNEPITTETTGTTATTHSTFAPYTDEDGHLVVDVSDYVFE